ncbi:TetR/AcrR family transcriptional regulator [Priestia flexa]|uniref:TetR/AcrR family transcriptional regulator n=1 Tax=Priestia flexa TaxID=86664 RepID=UPI003D2EF348
MPKVSQEYIEKKKAEILDVARKVCNEKSIHDVSMRDIVIATGMSQGGVYKYFANIDEIFSGLLNEETLNSQVKAKVDEIYASDVPPVQKLEKFLFYIGEYMEHSLLNKGTIFYKLMDLYSRYPDRYEKVKDQLHEVSNLEYLQKQFQRFLTKNISENVFNPSLSIENVVTLITTYLSGVISEINVGNKAVQEMSAEIKVKVHVLFLTLRDLLVK